MSSQHQANRTHDLQINGVSHKTPLSLHWYDDDRQELFQQKQHFMYSVFNKVLQSDMGKTIVRKYAPTLDAQAVWKEFETHMSTSSKVSTKGIDCMPMSPLLSMIGHGKALLNNWFSIFHEQGN